MASDKPCLEVQPGRRMTLTCSLAYGHSSAHMHKRADGRLIPWQHPQTAHGIRSKRPYKKYANPKLTRQSLQRPKAGLGRSTSK